MNCLTVGSYSAVASRINFINIRLLSLSSRRLRLYSARAIFHVTTIANNAPIAPTQPPSPACFSAASRTAFRYWPAASGADVEGVACDGVVGAGGVPVAVVAA